MISANDISSWYEAVQLYEVNRIDEAIEHFKAAKQNSKMMVNTGCCYLRKNDLKSAEEVEIEFSLNISYTCIQNRSEMKTALDLSSINTIAC